MITSVALDDPGFLVETIPGEKALPDRCREVDRPIAALITDLKQRGMLDETLIVWGGEFGRSAAEQNSGNGRRHQNLGYSMFIAGGGVRGGVAYGATDETGSRAVQGRIHTHTICTRPSCIYLGWTTNG